MGTEIKCEEEEDEERKRKKFLPLTFSFWILTILAGLMGILFGLTSVYIEVEAKMDIGLYFMVGSSSFFALAGLFATLAAKFQSERR